MSAFTPIGRRHELGRKRSVRFQCEFLEKLSSPPLKVLLSGTVVRFKIGWNNGGSALIPAGEGYCGLVNPLRNLDWLNSEARYTAQSGDFRRRTSRL